MRQLDPTNLVDREETENVILNAADDFLFWQAFLEKPPRLSDVKASLDILRIFAGRLHKSLHDLDYISLTALEDTGLFKHPLLLRRLGASDPGSEFERLVRGQGSILVTLLQALEEAADNALNSAEEADRGGTTRAFDMAAEDELAGYCIEIFERYRPGEVTESEDGDFTTFFDYVYWIATGEEFKIVRPIKRACRNWKTLQRRKHQEFPEGLPDDRMIVRHGAQWSIAKTGKI